MVCILENRVHEKSLCDPFFESTHSLFLNEASCHNFALSNSGRIWVKWNAAKLNFIPSRVTSQIISGNVFVANQALFQLSVIYASNSTIERKELWEDIALVRPVPSFPWAIIGDFNCCRYASEKLGGSPITQSTLIDFNNMIFHNSLLDLHSVGCKYTWYNQRLDNPIHIKLDLVLVNEGWMDAFSDSFCSFQSPSYSDHTPVILHSGNQTKVHHRFLFKNFWTRFEALWCHLLEVFSAPCNGNPLSSLYKTLKLLKTRIKNEVWASSSCLTRHLDHLLYNQNLLLEKLHIDPNNSEIILSYISCNAELAHFTNLQASWIIQRAKVNWLKFGEEDLKFLYDRICCRKGSSKSVVNLLSCNPTVSRIEVVSTISQIYQNLYNPALLPNSAVGDFPVGTALPYYFFSSIDSNVEDNDIKEVVFMGASNSAPGPDGFNFHFYKSCWHIIGPVVCRAVKSFFLKG
ncbi:uncharacterized protein LOC110097645 [Dendrobium catenatum]|uniref:uncharacterized protein LOC110097645 n=1 Tax=Dendrobium catenatum TaxID=906689 RepID=UPI0010A088ED|nr:uncharacterized protein LOC110097645 [Dendrobium catenatum]